jgi:hypothetical protein
MWRRKEFNEDRSPMVGPVSFDIEPLIMPSVHPRLKLKNAEGGKGK